MMTSTALRSQLKLAKVNKGVHREGPIVIF